MPENTTTRLSAYDIGPLLHALGSSDPEIQLTALDAILSLPVAEDVWQQVGEYCLYVLRGIKAQATDANLPPIRQFLWLAAIVPVIEIRDAMRMLAFSDHPDAQAIIYALAWAGDQAMQPLLLKQLQDTQAYADHIAIAEALSYLDVSDAKSTVQHLCLKHEDAFVRFFLSLPLARTGEYKGFTNLFQDIARGEVDLPILNGDPQVFADEVMERGPYPASFTGEVEGLAESLAINKLNALLSRLQIRPESVASSQQQASPEDEEKARTLAETWLANPPFSAKEYILPEQGALLPLLEQPIQAQVREMLLNDIRKAFRASSRFEGGNTLVTLPTVFWSGDDVINLLVEHYLKLPHSDSNYRSQLAWLLAQQNMPKVIAVVMQSLWQADNDDMRQGVLSLARDIGQQAGSINAPIFGGGGSRFKYRPPRGMLASLTEMHSLDFREEAMVSDRGGDETPELAERYANGTLYNDRDDSRPDKSQALMQDMVYRLRVDIGPLSKISDVENPQPIPKDLLPDEDLWLDVLFSSTDFAVGLSKESLCEENTVASTKLLLPQNGGPARAKNGALYVDFWLRTPADVGVARARLNLYYHNHLVQGLLFRAYIGEMPEITRIAEEEIPLASLPPLIDGFNLHTDFTLTRSLVDIEPLPLRRQVSILTNDNGNGRHQIIVRSGDENGNASNPITYELRENVIGSTISDIRAELRSSRIVPTTFKRTKRQLKDALTQLAPLGWQLRTLMGGETIELEDYLYDWDDVVIQVSRPNSSSAAFPWGLIYDIPIDTSKPFTFCPSVENWDEKSPLVEPDTHECPHGYHDTNVLCPYGFWAYRYPIEQLASTEEPATVIQVNEAPEMLTALTQYSVDVDALDAHIEALQTLTAQHIPHMHINTAKNLATIQANIGQDQPLIYFYCHGERLRNNDPNTFLGVGHREELKAQDFIGWVMAWRRPPTRHKIWRRVRPLVFINACHSLEITPETLVNYLDAFVGWGNAAGVIGTEVKVHQTLAMDFAMRFFAGFTAGETVADSLHAARMHYLANGNLFGLVYTPYCFADLHLDLASQSHTGRSTPSNPDEV